MIEDFLAYDGDDVIECDLCIAGAGAAGITIARQFIGTPTRVVVLESGGLDFEPDTQDLAIGRNVGLPYYDLDIARLRLLGGSTNHWGGMCTRLDPLDFEPRPWVPHSGWPIGFDDLDPWYRRAHEIVDLGPYEYDPADLVPEDAAYLPLDDGALRPKMWRYSVPPTNFNAKYRAELERAANVELWLHANLVEIEAEASGRAVGAFWTAILGGRSARVRSGAYVLALGGIENPRLLLNSNRVIGPGLGNERDLVGRFFMEHIGVIAGTALVAEGNWHEAYVEFLRDGQQLRCAIAPSPERQAQERVLNTMAMLGEVSLIRWHSKGYGALYEIKEALKSRQIPEDLALHLWNIITDLQGIVRGVAEKVDPTVYVTIEGEQAPNPDSRVRLGDERDALGLRRIELDWRLSEIDKRTIRVLTELIGSELGRIGAGRVRLDEWLMADDDGWPEELVGAFHHMGTTRMASDASQGVVDANGKVFGQGNLYVAGSSVFPTGGCANPTLTLVALALRLADHLQREAFSMSTGGLQIEPI
jgi:choline dehydrogenase-like flavoprotein